MQQDVLFNFLLRKAMRELAAQEFCGFYLISTMDNSIQAGSCSRTLGLPTLPAISRAVVARCYTVALKLY
jgi:hypothetical protein